MRRTLILGIGLAVLALAQSAMNNDSVIKMAKAGLSDDVIVGSINGQPGTYKTSADDLIALKSAGVSDKVIAAMISKASGGGAPPATLTAGAAAPTAAGPVNEVGVYYNKAGTWADLNPEVVNFKTGGVLKSIGTAGIVKGDINGHLNGEHSPNALKTPVEILIYTPEGTAATEYQLLRLHEQKDSREFRTMTGGVFHASGGATRDSIPFENKKIAPRTYQIILPADIGTGEYGILPPSSGDGTGSSGRIGKLYSFRIIE
ncbi:MAG TPA: hypothetical protein VMB03_13890 [Bryobacteraceae bacterium]|nr:hypothetical protein [Bryobacteraceae bacterium]